MSLFLVFLTGWLPQDSYQSFQNRTSESMVISKVQQAPIIDGYVDEAVWDTITPLHLVSYEPVAGLPPSEKTEVRIGYDNNYIYVSMRGYDSNSSGIRANSLYRDRISGDDVFHILLDTYNDNESAIGFTITPSGAKRDALISNDGEGPRALNADYSTYWDVATRINERGWFAEVRIPFSSLGFQDVDGRVEMGLYVQRGIARKNERITFPEVPANIARAYFKPSLAQKIVFNDIKSSRLLHITPYLSGGLEQNQQLNESGIKYSKNNDYTYETGFDIKYGLASNLNLDLTVNTDFAQVEADDQQINLTRFNLFFPEKRQFFQERSSVFEFVTGDNGRLFNSRRIGLSESGQPVRILAGGRLTGRVGDWDIGVLNMQTDKFQGAPSENFGVMRLRREIINPYSYSGGMFTSRIGADGNYNIGVGIDGNIRIRENEYFSFIWAHSMEEETQQASLFSTSEIKLNLENRSREGFAYLSTLGLSGEYYNPGMGFITRKNYYLASQELRYGWIPDNESPLLWHSLQAAGNVYFRKTTEQIESAEASLMWNGTTKPGGQIETALSWFYEDIPFTFSLLNTVMIEAGQYRFFRGIASYRMPSSSRLRTKIELDAGSFYDGWRVTGSVSPTWNVSKHLELEASYLYNRIDVEQTEDWFTVHVGQLRVRTALNTKLSTNAFMQFNSSADIMSTNIRFRYNIRDGNDFWIVYNEGINTDRNRFTPQLPRTSGRSLLVKYTHTFHY